MSKSRKNRAFGRNQRDSLLVAPNVAEEPKNWAWAFAFTLSIVLHVVLGGRHPVEAAAPANEQVPLDIEVLWLETPAPPTEPPQTDPPAVSERQQASAHPSPRRRERPSERSAEGLGAENSIVTLPTPTAGESAPGPEAPTLPPFDVARLQPSAVARGTFGPRLSTPEDREAALESALQADLYRMANAADYDTVRPAPELRETGDGGYTFQGHLFDARISPSGEVSFSDGSNFAYGGPGGPGGALGFTFDISAAAERAAGNDPHAAERRWFMEQTRRTRDRLAAQARARIQGRGLVRLRRQIRAIWDSGEPAAERREQLFRLWDSCEEDEVGAEARVVILQFIREHPGPQRADVFPIRELRRLNGSRMSREVFAPY